MARNKLQDLRDHLFETLERLKDEEKPLDVERAKAIVQVSQTIIDSARVQVKFMDVTGVRPEEMSAGEFFDDQQKKLPVTVTSGRAKANGGLHQ